MQQLEKAKLHSQYHHVPVQIGSAQQGSWASVGATTHQQHRADEVSQTALLDSMYSWWNVS
jgi:hypothetical protein